MIHIFSVMKKLALPIALVVLFFATSCTSYTCPTYAKKDVKTTEQADKLPSAKL